MHDFWVWVYARTSHLHRDPVANVVIYCSLSFFGACIALIVGAPAYSLLAESHPCVGMSIQHQRAQHLSLDTCHFILARVENAIFD